MKTLFTIILLCLFTLAAFSQNITNTLGPGGLFKIKDATTDFFTLNQSNGTITLPSQLAGNQLGSIFKGSDRFLHTYHGAGTEGFNTFLGVNAGNFTMGGNDLHFSSYNTAVGYNSLKSIAGGSYNSAFGINSLSSNVGGWHNSAFGSYSLSGNTTGSDNSAFGITSLSDNTTGSYNSAFGSYTLKDNTTGQYNSAFGHQSLYLNTTGSNNSAFGEGSLFNNKTGFRNSAFGVFSLRRNTTGYSNTALGCHSLQENTTGYENTAVGDSSLHSNTEGLYNSAVGYASLKDNTTGDYNTAVGYGSLSSNTTSLSNTAVGSNSLKNNTGVGNSALGRDALISNTLGNYNVAVGRSSLSSNTTGDYNVAVGYSTGGSITTGNNLTCIGYNAEPTSGSVTNQITLGNASVTSLRCAVTTITALSDARDKKNIQDLRLGIDFLMKLKPRIYNWDKREWYENNISDGSKIKEEPTAGFIAQELDEVQTSENAEWLNLVLKDNPEKLEATPGNLMPIIVKAIQDLKTEKDNEIASLKEENVLLKNNNDKLSAEVESLKLMNEKLTSLEQLVIELTSTKQASFSIAK